jgi:hypothetical protein
VSIDRAFERARRYVYLEGAQWGSPTDMLWYMDWLMNSRFGPAPWINA